MAKKAFEIAQIESGYRISWETLTDGGRKQWEDKARIIMAALDELE